MSTTTSAAAAASSSATLGIPSDLKVVGIILAIVSGLLIGSSFVFKKKGLLRSQAEGAIAGEGVAYLKSPLWWLGMSMMILGELCNFAAYSFVEAIVVTPLGALSVVICAILSSLFLQEKLSFFGWLGCALCIIGSVIIALNGPQEPSVGQIKAFQKLFLSPGFLVYGGVLVTAALVIIFYFAPRYGTKSMLWYIMVCSMIGGISVSVTTGLGSAIVTTAMGDNQFKYWFIYFLLVFIIVTLVTEVFYLNKALALFNTAMVTPTYYVIFTFFSMLTTIVLFKGLSAPAMQIITLVMGFLVICVGITILQLSKIDPTQIKMLDRRTTILLQAANARTEAMDDEKSITAIEDPGVDALRGGGFGVVGSILRARRMSMSSHGTARSRHGQHPSSLSDAGGDPLHGMTRHQLYDAPMPTLPGSPELRPREDISMTSAFGSPTPRQQTIKFGNEDVVHSYPRPGSHGALATHVVRSPPPPPLASGSRLAPAPAPTPALFSDAPYDPYDLDGAPVPHPTPTLLHTYAADDPFSPATPTSATAFVPPRASPERHARTRTRSRSGSRSGHQRFGRSSSASRRYPRGDEEEDREESLGLWSPDEEEEEEDYGDVEGAGAGVLPKGGIRLVSSPRR